MLAVSGAEQLNTSGAQGDGDSPAQTLAGTGHNGNFVRERHSLGVPRAKWFQPMDSRGLYCPLEFSTPLPSEQVLVLWRCTMVGGLGFPLGMRLSSCYPSTDDFWNDILPS